MKIVVNRDYGVFQLSQEAVEEYARLKSIEPPLAFKLDQGRKIERNDPALVEVVEKMGEKANGIFADLRVVTIPDGVEWEIQDYDGKETIHEAHRSW